MKIKTLIANHIGTKDFWLGALYSVVLLGMGWGISDYRNRYDYTRTDVSSDLAYIEYFKAVTPETLVQELQRNYSATPEAIQSVAKCDTDRMYRQLQMATMLLKVDLDQEVEIPLALDETVFRLNKYPMVLFPESQRAVQRAPVMVSWDERKAIQVKLDEAKRVFHERLAKFIIDERETFSTWDQPKRLAYVNLIHIVMHELSFNEYGNRKQLTELHEKFSELLGERT